MDEARHEAGSAGRGYEVADAKVGLLVAAGGVLLVLMVLAAILMAGMFGLLAKRKAAGDAPPSPMAEFRQPPPGPRLQTDPSEELKSVRASADALLTQYGWVDRENRIVRIPVSRAIDLLAERGLPVREGGGR